MNDYKVTENIKIENAHFMVRNFSGRESQYNRPGQKNFCVYIDDERYAQQLIDDGWNVRVRAPREDGDEIRYYLQVAVSFDNIPPTIYMITKRRRVKLDEESVSALDFAEIRNVDMIIRPYNWIMQEGTKNEKSGVKAYLRTMHPVLHLFPDFNGLVDSLLGDGFFTAPASTKHHGSYEGGLFEHSCNVTTTLVTLTKDCGLAWSRPESPYIVGMFHDLCKADAYRHPELTHLSAEEFIEYVKDNDEVGDVDKTKWEHNPDTLLKGHGEKSVMLLSRYLQLTMEEILCIRYHMGAFTDQKEWSDYTRAVQQYDTVLWTHHADMIATHIIEK